MSEVPSVQYHFHFHTTSEPAKRSRTTKEKKLTNEDYARLIADKEEEFRKAMDKLSPEMKEVLKSIVAEGKTRYHQKE